MSQDKGRKPGRGKPAGERASHARSEQSRGERSGAQRHERGGARKGERGFAYRIRCLAVQSNSQTVLPANRLSRQWPHDVQNAQGLRHGIKLVTVLRD